MNGLRFSVAQLMIAIAVVAVGIVALNSGSRVFGGVLLLGLFVLLLTAALRVIFHSGRSRAFWVGVSVFGWFYILLAFSPWLDSARGVIERPLIAFRAKFWTTRVPDGGDHSVFREMDTDYDRAAKQTLGWPAWHTFGPTAHTLVAFLFCLLGGIIARSIYARAETERLRK